jgi:hypothetical protein
MQDFDAYHWTFDESAFAERPDTETFSVGVYQWLPKAAGKGLKKSNTLRVHGYTADAESVYELASQLCRRLNAEKVVLAQPPKWLQRSYSVPRPDIARTTTARDCLKALIRDHLAPALKPLGFRSSGLKLWRGTPEVCQLIHFELHWFGTKTHGVFSVYLGVLWHEIEAALNKASGAKVPPALTACTISINLGWIMPVGHGQLWRIDTETDLTLLGGQLLDAINPGGIRYLESRSDLHQILDKRGYREKTQLASGLSSNPEPLGFWRYLLLLMKLGRTAQATTELQHLLQVGYDPKGIDAFAARFNIPLTVR